MGAITPPSHERLAVDVVLQSGIFDRAPRLGNFFRYICEQHLQGDGDQIKEYSIALEALGRPTDFDPKKDSIVRVEAHRLRRRLQTYYRGPGACQPIQIVIPNGQYRPQFVSKKDAEGLETEPGNHDGASFIEEPPSPSSGVLVASQKRRTHGAVLWMVVAPFLLVAVSGMVALLHGVQKTPTPRVAAKPAARTDDVWTGPATEPIPAEFRMLAGYHGPPFSDRQGHTWNPDAYYSGGVGEVVPPGRHIEYQPDPNLIRTERSGRFHYDIPMNSGPHELQLYFVETEYGQGNPKGGGDASHLFRVAVNGTVQFGFLDVLAQAGAPNRLYVAVLKDVSPGPDGKLHLSFDPVSGPAILNGIEILQSSAGRIHPVRIVAQASPVTDADGRLWAADEYVSGGALVWRHQTVLNPPDKCLYQGERYGNFCYRIPLARGRYRLTLHFAETYFGTAVSSYENVSQRCFDVYANGVSLLRNYQVARDAGGPERSVAKIFENVEPNAQGILQLNFVPVRNYAEVNAIEVVETK
jgi:hypothetical protein